MAGLTIETKLRPCWVNIYKNGRKGIRTQGLFHCWNYMSDVVDASPLIGGHPGGVISYTVGIVELEDGSIIFASPTDINFVEGIFNEYSWGNEKEKRNEN